MSRGASTSGSTVNLESVKEGSLVDGCEEDTVG